MLLVKIRNIDAGNLKNVALFRHCGLKLFIHKPLDTHLRSLLERLVHDLNLLELAV